jgi:hypothetical protein
MDFPDLAPLEVPDAKYCQIFLYTDRRPKVLFSGFYSQEQLLSLGKNPQDCEQRTNEQLAPRGGLQMKRVPAVYG